MQAKVGIVGVDIHDGVHLVDQALVTQGAEHFTDVSAVDGLHDALLEVHGEAFVQPKVIPCRIGHEVATPAVCELVRHKGNEAAISCDDGGGGKRQSWVLHAAKGECCGEHKQVVTLPRVLAVEPFGRHEHVLHFGKLVFYGIDQI